MASVITELVKRKWLTRQQFNEAQIKRSMVKVSMQDVLVETGQLDDELLFKLAQKIVPYPVFDLTQVKLDTELVKLIPYERAVFHGVFPVYKEGESLVLAMSDPFDLVARDELCFHTHLDIKPVLSPRRQITDCIKKYYNAAYTVHDILKSAMEDIRTEPVFEKDKQNQDEIVDLALLEGELSTLVKFVNKLITDAIEMRASDIHIEPREQIVEVRYRIDGHLRNIIQIPPHLHQRLAARIKIMSKLDIAEQRKAQDGRFKIMVKDNKIDLRISIIPLIHGEKIVMRILDTNNAQFDINTIGFEPEDLELFKAGIQRPQGVVLVTGPTGSGKTTTLYAALQQIKSESKNIVTIEDPVEYLIEGINQVQLNRYKDVTFASGLRSILRQDPDVILVGEIRDRETADIAFRASMTGHLVFSTLHTNSAASSVSRLLDIGLEPYLIASSTIFLVAQRLVGLICPHCRKTHRPEKKLLTHTDSRPLLSFSMVRIETASLSVTWERSLKNDIEACSGRRQGLNVELSQTTRSMLPGIQPGWDGCWQFTLVRLKMVFLSLSLWPTTPKNQK